MSPRLCMTRVRSCVYRCACVYIPWKSGRWYHSTNSPDQLSSFCSCWAAFFRFAFVAFQLTALRNHTNPCSCLDSDQAMWSFSEEMSLMSNMWFQLVSFSCSNTHTEKKNKIDTSFVFTQCLKTSTPRQSSTKKKQKKKNSRGQPKQQRSARGGGKRQWRHTHPF